MGIHGCYADDMKLLWQHKGPYVNQSNLKNLKSNSKLCNAKGGYNWDLFPDIWKYEPKTCISNPTWKQKIPTKDGAYLGRSKTK